MLGAIRGGRKLVAVIDELHNGVVKILLEFVLQKHFQENGLLDCSLSL